MIFVRPSVRACARPSVKIQVVIEIFLGIKNQDTCPDTFYAERPQNARTRRYKPQKAFFLKQNFNKFWFLSKVRAIWHHTETWVLSLGRPEFRRKLILESKKMLAFLANCRRYVDSACSFEKLTISSKNLPVEGTEGAYCGIQISARNSFLKQRIVGENDKIIFRNLEWQFVSKVDVQETALTAASRYPPAIRFWSSELPVKMTKLFSKFGMAICEQSWCPRNAVQMQT